VTNRTRRDPRQLQREKLLFRYTGALERGDFETVASVLREAERDAALATLLHDLNEELASELRPLKASSNGKHPVMQTQPPITSHARQPAVQRPRPVYPFTLAAAMLIVALFSGLLLLNRPTPSTEDPTAAALGMNATTTEAIAPTSTPIPSQSTADTLPSAAPPPAVPCEGLVNWGDGINLFAEPDVNAEVISRLPLGFSVQIINQDNHPFEQGDNIYWVQVNSQSEAGQVVGWVQGTNLSMTTLCPIFNSVYAPTPISPIGIGPIEGAGYVLRSDLGGIAAGTPVQIMSGYYDGTTWRYEVQWQGGQLDHVPLDQLIPMTGMPPAELMTICIFNIGSDGGNLYLAPDASSPVMAPIEAGSEVTGIIVTTVQMPGGEQWLLVDLATSPSVNGWLRQDDLRDEQIACSPSAAGDFMFASPPYEFGTFPMLPLTAGTIEAQLLWPATALPPPETSPATASPVPTPVPSTPP
jgi:hypothetical protein